MADDKDQNNRGKRSDKPKKDGFFARLTDRIVNLDPEGERQKKLEKEIDEWQDKEE